MNIQPVLLGTMLALVLPFTLPVAGVTPTPGVSRQVVATNRLVATDAGALGDGKTLNTSVVQKAIDQLAAKGGGTLVIPKGVFLSGALFLKPDVNLHFEEGAVLKGSTNRDDYPRKRTRIEGHFEEWLPALVNAEKTDHLRIDGKGMLDGSGAAFWQEFWDRRKANRQTKNLDVGRPRLLLVHSSQDVQVRGITFHNSAFWNLHLYRCQNVTVEDCRFEVPDGVKCPSTDGTDVDSSRDVTIRHCAYRVDDDCIALKGSKGPLARDDKDSPPVEHIRVSDCIFERGNGVLTLGSEATVVRDAVAEHCRVTGASHVACLKLRPDTPQTYEDIHFQDITLDSAGGTVLQILPWRQYFDLQGQPPPKSLVRNITLSHITGKFGAFGDVQGNRDQTEIRDIHVDHATLHLKRPALRGADAKEVRLMDVTVNDTAMTQ